MITDIVVTTCDRLPLLKQTLNHIWLRTTTPYRLHVIDDASTEGNTDYLRDLAVEDRIDNLVLNKQRQGIPAHLRRLLALTDSDPLVFTDDDILCPLLEPDWLLQGLTAMAKWPRLGLLALNSPQCNIGGKRGHTESQGEVTFCRNVPGSFVFVRREVLQKCSVPDGTASPVKLLCRLAHQAGWRVGYLTHVYCQHIGEVSVRNGKKLAGELDQVTPLSETTLIPPEQFRG